MKFGKFEIDETVLIWLLLAIIVIALVISDYKLQVEQEKTKQLEIQMKEVNTIE